MPAAGKYPRLRCHVRNGRGKQAYTYWYYDMRGTGEKDVPLGNDRATAVARWDEIANGRPAKIGRLLQAARLRLQHDTEKLTRDHYRPGADARDPVI